MTTEEILLAVGLFAAGAAAATLGWWIYGRFLADPADVPSAPPPPTGASTPPSHTTPPKRPSGLMRTSQRVVVHIGAQPRLAYGDVATVELTQAGMSRSLGVAQPALARVLQRLIDGDAVLVMRTHVKGESKRLKVYQLTVHGEAIAKDLRVQAARGRPPVVRATGGLSSELRNPPSSAPIEA